MKILFYLILFLNIAAASDSLKVATYNILNYSGSTRTEYLRTVASGLNADVLIVQEILSQEAVDSFTVSVLQNRYETIAFHDGYDSDNHIFYKAEKVEFLGDNYIATELRDIAEYILLIKSNSDTLRIFSVHLKASSGSDNEQKRLAECTELVNHVSVLSTESKYIVVGDMNFYDSDEPGYQKLMEKFRDPISSPGNWHNNGDFASLHTQSPRVEQFGGGASGGMDDRFDFILVSEALVEKVAENSYQAFENDGQYFNLSINDGRDTPIADALYYGSDHLPVECILVFDETSGIGENGSALPGKLELGNNYPNPFNPVTRIPFYLGQAGVTTLSVYSSEGKKVGEYGGEVLGAGTHYLDVDMEGMPSGSYFYRLRSGKSRAVGKMQLVK